MIKLIRDEPLGNWFTKYSGKSFWVRLVDLHKGVLMLTGTGSDYLYLNDFSQGMDVILRDLLGDRVINQKVKLTESVDFVLVNRPELGICLGPSVNPIERAMIPSLRSNLEVLGVGLVMFEEASDLSDWVSVQSDGYRFGMIIHHFKHNDSYRIEYPHLEKYGVWLDQSGFIEHLFKTSVDTERFHWLSEFKLVDHSIGIG